MREALKAATFDVDRLPPCFDVVSEVRALATTLTEPWQWELLSVTDPEVLLTFAVQREVGYLIYFDGSEFWLPALGETTTETACRMTGLHETAMPPGSRVSADAVYLATTDFLASRSRPVCLEWVREAQTDLTAPR